LISTIKPYRPVTRNNISRWIKTVSKLSGVDKDKFKSHSVRTASTSAAKAANVPILTIMKSAGWKRESIFRKFYNKPIMSNDGKFSANILEKLGGKFEVLKFRWNSLFGLFSFGLL
jgi:hypothetical protein